MLYTGKGDNGTTSVFGAPGTISKTSAVIEALGALDELNSLLGVCRAHCPSDVSPLLHEFQQDLFIIQAQLAGAPKEMPSFKIEKLEEKIAAIEAALPPIKTFFIPGATEAGAFLDLARTVARRAERRVVAHQETGALVPETTLHYMNRLSSALYALARQVNHSSGITEEPPTYR